MPSLRLFVFRVILLIISGNKYITPLIINGKVYVGTTNSVGVFGLLSAAAK